MLLTYSLLKRARTRSLSDSSVTLFFRLLGKDSHPLLQLSALDVTHRAEYSWQRDKQFMLICSPNDNRVSITIIYRWFFLHLHLNASRWQQVTVYMKEWVIESFNSFVQKHWFFKEQNKAVFEMPYYHTTLTISAACSMYAAHSIKFSVCMEYLDYLLFLPESAKYNSSTLKSVQKLCSEWHTIIQLLLYCSMLCEYCEYMWIFCMHGMPGLPATFAEIWCMHLRTLRVILFPRTQHAPCDVSSSNTWVNWRRGIVVINVTLVYVPYVYIYM